MQPFRDFKGINSIGIVRTTQRIYCKKGMVTNMKCKKCGWECEKGDTFCTRCGSKMKEMNKTNLGIWIYVGATAILLVIAFLAALLFGLGKVDYEKQMVYIKDNKIYYMENMDSDKEPCCVAEIDNDSNQDVFIGANVSNLDEYEVDSSMNAKLTISRDKKYIYFFSELTESGDGTLSRILIEKIKADASANKKNIENITDEITNAVILDDGTIVYSQGVGKLIYWDGKKEARIASKGTNLFVSGDQKTIWYGDENASGQKTLCNYDIANKKINKLAEDVCSIYYTKGGVYYTVPEEHEGTLYDFVTDQYAEQDEIYKDSYPTFKDYLFPITMEEALSSEDYEFLTENPDAWEAFIEYLDYDEVEDLYFYYSDEADENDVFSLYAYDKELDQWYWFDQYLALEIIGNSYDIEMRIKLRKEMKEEVYTYSTYDLYYLPLEAESQLVAENINNVTLQVESENNFVAYQERKEPEISFDLSEVDGCETVRISLDAELSTEMTDAKMNYLIGEQKEKLNLAVKNISEIAVSEDGSKMILCCDYEYDLLFDEGSATLYQVDINEGKLGIPEKIGEDACEGAWRGNVYYFLDTSKRLYKYENSKTEKILEYVGYAAISEEGNILTTENQTPDQMMYFYNTDGDKKEKKKGIWLFEYINENRIVYMVGDKLYVYRGDDGSTKLAKDVEYLYCLDGKDLQVMQN